MTDRALNTPLPDNKQKQKKKHAYHSGNRSSLSEVLLGVLKICSKFREEHAYQSVISIKLLCKFIQIMKSHFGMGVSCKFSAYFQSFFLYEHIWRAASMGSQNHLINPILVEKNKPNG